eukprot:5386562-Pleurochrysis_carterae.AAC.1
MQTDPRGIQFVLDPPDIEKDPGVELWEGTGDAETEDGDGWNREKVIRDVMTTARIENFSAAQGCRTHIAVAVSNCRVERAL